MTIRIDKTSDVPIRIQISEQIAMSIVMRVLKPGDTLKSTREVARRLRISRNTVSAAYQDLVRRLYVERHRGGKMIVRVIGKLVPSAKQDLDDVIDSAIQMARERGYTLQQLRGRIRDRLLTQPPDHVLIAEDEPGMRGLLQREISGLLRVAADAISPEELLQNHGRLIGALVIALPRRAQRVESLLPKHHPFLVLQPSGIDNHLKLIHQMKTESVIGIASVSQLLLETAHNILAPFIGSFHALEEHQVREMETIDLRGLDLVFCDTVTRNQVKARPGRLAHYRVISDAAVQEIGRNIGQVGD
jgi:GntR family transcriptional regulator